jgi:hypothetical protein
MRLDVGNMRGSAVTIDAGRNRGAEHHRWGVQEAERKRDRGQSGQALSENLAALPSHCRGR